GAAVNAAAIGTERPTGGVKRTRRTRVHHNGHDHVIMICANTPEQCPVVACVAGTKYVAIRCAEKKGAGASGNGAERLNVAAWRTDLSPGFGLGRQPENER